MHNRQIFVLYENGGNTLKDATMFHTFEKMKRYIDNHVSPAPYEIDVRASDCNQER